MLFYATAEYSCFINNQIKSILNSIGGADSSFQITPLNYHSSLFSSYYLSLPLNCSFSFFFSLTCLRLMRCRFVGGAAPRNWKTWIHCKQRNRQHYKKRNWWYFIPSFQSPQRPFSNKRIFFPVQSNSTRQKLSRVFSFFFFPSSLD